MDETVFISLRKFPKSLKARMANWKPHYVKHLGMENMSNEIYFARLVSIGLEEVMPGGGDVFVVPVGIEEWTGGLREGEEVVTP